MSFLFASVRIMSQLCSVKLFQSCKDISIGQN
nr:MAG TPA: hypothetical protein [Caudoviricetes sp.]